MAPELKQQGRTVELKTPLGKDKLAITSFEGYEGLSELFTFTIEAVSKTEITDFDRALGDKCTVSVSGDEMVRHFNGILVETQWLGVRNNLYTYRLVLRPWLWLLSRVSDCRIFANRTPPEIISDIFAKHGFAASDKKLADYDPIEYYVQYRETDLDFVTRVMEEFGIYYFFRHEDGEHILMLADAKSSHERLPGGGNIPFRPFHSQGHRAEHLSTWVPGRRFNTGRVVLNDYDYLNPNTSLLSEQESASSYRNSKLEAFDYPGRYVKQADGKKHARVRLEAEQATDNRSQAVGAAVSLFPGALMSLVDHPSKSQNEEYLVVRASHTVANQQYGSGYSTGGEDTYSGDYEFLLGDKPFRAPMVTPRPVVRGPQTAKVIGVSDDQIHTDKHGCIKVQFHWDRDKKDDREKKARWVRVGQVWSGKNWGGIFIPRVGMEVIVEFLEGDPDQPLVVGTVYNGENEPPYELPKFKNIAGWKSRSNPKGGGEHYNELQFDDTIGSEKIIIHAQNDMETTVENNDTQSVGSDRKIHVEGTHSEMVDGVMTIESQTKIVLKVGPFSSITIDAGSITLNSCVINVTASGAISESAPLTTITGTTSLMLATNVFVAKLITF